MRSIAIIAVAALAAPAAVLAQNQPVGAKPALKTTILHLKSADGKAAVTGSLPFTNLAALNVSDVRIDVDLEEASVRDALKQIFERGKQEYRIDEDVSSERRITLKAKNVRLSTALELVAQAAGVGLGRELKDGKLAYRITKSGADSTSPLTVLRYLADVKDLKFTQPGEAYKHIEQYLKVLPNQQQWLPYVHGVREQRATFRCPHCKGQATVIRAVQEPKCEKCTRVFQPDWQFCPADGAKRPAGAAGQWKFCPFCSKKVEEKDAGIPILSDIPFIGSLFRVTPPEAEAPVQPPPPVVVRPERGP
jgi:hypothetical protein